MDKYKDDQNKAKLISIYDAIPEASKQSFMEALEYLQICFLADMKKSSKP